MPAEKGESLMNEVRRQIAHNHSLRRHAIEYIVIHDTGNTAKGADAEAHFRYFNSQNRNSSADIFVDDHAVWYVNDYTRFYTWHSGDGKGKYGIANQNSIGIELCINQDADKEKALDNLVIVVQRLMKELNIPVGRVVRHYDASRKCCPKSMAENGWSKWKEFQTKIKGGMSMNQYQELKNEINDLTQTVKQLATKVGNLEHPAVYHSIDETLPQWAKEAVCWAVDCGFIQGDGTGLALTEEKLWMLTVLYRIIKEKK